MRTYSELIKIPSYKDRFEYLRLDGEVGKDTFGFDRYLNQQFYKSAEWKRIRTHVIVRDCGCDMAFPETEIAGRIYIHHMNPIAAQDLIHGSGIVTDPEFLVCVSYDTHNAIHYGDYSLIKPMEVVERKEGDTCPWKII